MATLRGRALTWWNGRTKAMGIEAANNTPWSEVRKWMTGMVEPEAVKVEQYIRGLTKSIRGDVTSSQPATINDAVRLAYQLAGQLIQDKADEATEGEKRKGKGAMTNAAPNNNETCQKCKNKRHAGDCWKCTKCGKLGHKTERCQTSEMNCYNFEEKGHRKRDCPELGRNGQGGNNRGGVYQLGAMNAQEDPKVVTGDRNQSRLKIISCIKARKYIENGCKLFLAQVTGTVSKEKRVKDVPIIRDFPE
nr:hypothetical protein [Tanacetum cinerariifolium]